MSTKPVAAKENVLNQPEFVDALATAILHRMGEMIIAEHPSNALADLLRMQFDRLQKEAERDAKAKKQLERMYRLCDPPKSPEPEPIHNRYQFFRTAYRWECQFPECRAGNNIFPEIAEGGNFEQIGMQCWSCKRPHTFSFLNRHIRLIQVGGL